MEKIWRHDIRHNGIQPYDTQHNNILNEGTLYDNIFPLVSFWWVWLYCAINLSVILLLLLWWMSLWWVLLHWMSWHQELEGYSQIILGRTHDHYERRSTQENNTWDFTSKFCHLMAGYLIEFDQFTTIYSCKIGNFRHLVL